MSEIKEITFFVKKYAFIKEGNIDLSFMPALSRRKLSLVDKLSLCAMHKCYENPEVKIVFASQYGELERLDKIIEQYTTENEVSPAAFSGSVHNSAPGVFSLLNKITNSYNAVSAEYNTFSNGLLEAIITEGDVLFCCTDTINSVYGFSCLISKKDGSGKKFFIKMKEQPERKTDDEPEKFLAVLNGSAKSYDSGLYTIEG